MSRWPAAARSAASRPASSGDSATRSSGPTSAPPARSTSAAAKRALAVGVRERWRVVVRRCGRHGRRPVHRCLPAERSPPRAWEIRARDVSRGAGRGSSLVSAPSTRRAQLMATRRHLNFDLLLEQEETAATRRASPTPARRDPQRPLRAAVRRDHAREPPPQARPGAVGHRRVGGTGQQQAAMDFGGPLYKAVFTGDLALAWQRSLDQVRAEQAGGLRLRLRLNDAPAIAGLPWELLYDARSTTSWRSRSARRWCGSSTCRRCRDRSRSTGRCACWRSSPRRSTSTSSTSRPSGPGSRRPSSRGPRPGWSCSTGCRARRSRSPRHLAPPFETHVVHFIGHGDFDPGLREGVIYFQDQAGRRSAVTSSTLGPYLRDHDPLRMVVLNACRSARTDSTDPFGGMAQGLVQQDATAVVAMQFPISDRAAVKFTGEFYGALVDGQPVDQAVSSARKSLLDGFQDEWATPVLFLRSPDGNIFENVHAGPGVVPVGPDEVRPDRPGRRSGSPPRAGSQATARWCSALPGGSSCSWSPSSSSYGSVTTTYPSPASRSPTSSCWWLPATTRRTPRLPVRRDHRRGGPEVADDRHHERVQPRAQPGPDHDDLLAQACCGQPAAPDGDQREGDRPCSTRAR